MKTFGEWVRELRIVKGLTQEELAAACGLSPEFVCRLERDRKLDPKLSTLRALARGFGMKVGELVDPPREKLLERAMSRERAAAETGMIERMARAAGAARGDAA